MRTENILICPICKNPIFKVERSLKCECGHSYDFAKSGYVNLLNPGKKNNAKAGDEKEMIKARSLFFSCGAYSKINDKICALVSEFRPNVVIDAGCGEGYYTNEIARQCSGSTVLGFDMSKFGCEHASKVARASSIVGSFFAVSNIFDMPVVDSCADVVVNMFAPVAREEFLRVLRDKGYLIVAVASEHHLEGLKRAIYDEAYLNEVKVPEHEGFELISKEKLSYVCEIQGNETINALFQMTPYYHRTSLKDKDKLKTLESIKTTIEVDFYIFQKS